MCVCVCLLRILPVAAEFPAVLKSVFALIFDSNSAAASCSGDHVDKPALEPWHVCMYACVRVCIGTNALPLGGREGEESKSV